MKKIPVMWGGVFATFAPNLILKDNVGDYVGDVDIEQTRFFNSSD